MVLNVLVDLSFVKMPFEIVVGTVGYQNLEVSGSKLKKLKAPYMPLAVSSTTFHALKIIDSSLDVACSGNEEHVS